MNSERYSHKHSISIMCNQVVDGAMTATIEIVTVDLDDFIFLFFSSRRRMLLTAVFLQLR